MSVPGADFSLLVFDNPPSLTKWQTFLPNVRRKWLLQGMLFCFFLICVKSFFFLWLHALHSYVITWLGIGTGHTTFIQWVLLNTHRMQRLQSFLFNPGFILSHWLSFRLLSSLCHHVSMLPLPDEMYIIYMPSCITAPFFSSMRDVKIILWCVTHHYCLT